MKLRKIHALHFDLSDCDKFFLCQADDLLIVFCDLGIEPLAGQAGDTAKSDEQRFVRALGLGTRGVDVVVDPKIRAPGVFILQYVQQLGLAESRLAKRNEQRSQDDVGEIFCFHHD